jgi:DeoR/GlpR family transcriptional regulator of sugar metabolism
MWMEERQSRILDLLKLEGRVETETLANTLEVSRETIRRDILQLEAVGLVRRVHGGAVSLKPLIEASVHERRFRLAEEKHVISRAAAALISPGQSCFVDGGTTTAIFATALAAIANVTVITNSLNVAAAIRQARPRADVILAGGQVAEDGSANYGEFTIEQLQRFNTDVAILSPVGLHPEKGMTYYAMPETQVARVMQSRAGRTIVLADHTKLGLFSYIVSFPCRSIDTLVTDRIESADIEYFQEAGIRQVVQASRP